MKIVIVSDIHANLAAIEALPETSYDQLWCLGDIVSYGPRPHETIRWIMTHARATVRGNHDQAVGFAVTPECSPSYRALAAATRQHTHEVCIHLMPISERDRQTLISILINGQLLTPQSEAEILLAR